MPSSIPNLTTSRITRVFEGTPGYASEFRTLIDVYSDSQTDAAIAAGVTSLTIGAALGYTAANDATVVKTSGDQTVGGFKRFTSGIQPLLIRFDDDAANFIWAAAGSLRMYAGDGSISYLSDSTSTTFYKASTFNSDVTFLSKVQIGPITFATLPSASANTGSMLRITDRSQKHAYSDGTNWRFFVDDSIVS